MFAENEMKFDAIASNQVPISSTSLLLLLA
jgi:hypothetical protein